MLLVSDKIEVRANVWLCLRERGKLVPGSQRGGHNVFTTTGKSWLTKLISWQAIGGTDTPYTHRRVRWMGVGVGTQLESVNVTSLVAPVLSTSTDYLRPIQTVEFPNSTSVRFLKEFGASEVNITGVPILITEIGLYADVLPANAGGTEDASYNLGNPALTTLDPTAANNACIAYKAFDGLSKTADFTLSITWEFRF